MVLGLIVAFLIIFPVGKVVAQQQGMGTAQIGTGAVGEIAEDDIVQMLTQIVSQPPGSSITAIPGQNKLIVRNTPSNLKIIEKFIEELGTPPQVSIEAKFVSVGEETFRDLGLEWGSFSFNWANPIGRTKRYSGLPGGGAWTYDTINGSITSGVGDTPDNGLLLTYRSLNYPALEATLHLLSTRADTKFLSAPTITTLNNEPATVRFVTTVRYVDTVDVTTETTEATVAGAAPTTTTTLDWAFIDRDVGIVLYVNPLVIKPTQSVRLFLQPVVSEIVPGTIPYTISRTTGQQDITITPPSFTSRDATTNVNVHDGTTIVLGGLMNEETTKLISKIPFLGDIPIIGKAFFQRQIDSTERQHLLIFITVHVLDSQGNPYFAKG